jgi:hypothetical protein
MHVTTAGTVATWWFVPDEATSWFSQAQRDSLYRALTSSFGSICFGSFLVAIVQALRALEQYTRDERDYQFLTCIIQCILACIESFIEYVNRWAYVYIGMYGFSYLEAGKNVVELFQNKGWTVVITDDLAANVLSLIALSIGLASGIVGLVLGYMSPNMFVSLGYEEAHGPAFFVGLLVGFLFASVILSVVGSAINTVIVCKYTTRSFSRYSIEKVVLHIHMLFVQRIQAMLKIPLLSKRITLSWRRQCERHGFRPGQEFRWFKKGLNAFSGWCIDFFIYFMILFLFKNHTLFN